MRVSTTTTTTRNPTEAEVLSSSDNGTDLLPAVIVLAILCVLLILAFVGSIVYFKRCGSDVHVHVHACKPYTFQKFNQDI